MRESQQYELLMNYTLTNCVLITKYAQGKSNIPCNLDVCKWIVLLPWLQKLEHQVDRVGELRR
jgi:hypothetical protein